MSGSARRTPAPEAGAPLAAEWLLERELRGVAACDDDLDPRVREELEALRQGLERFRSVVRRFRARAL